MVIKRCHVMLSLLLAVVLAGQWAHAEQRSMLRGYYSRLDVVSNGQQFSFGPFVGYYFKPQVGDDLGHLEFLCFNERGFYTDEMPKDSLLFRGEAVLTMLSETGEIPQTKQRITPIFFADAPSDWLQQRPEPQEEFVHFHSAYNRQGAVYTGYWLRHDAVTAFTYNMGGRISADSPLYHRAKPGASDRFPHIIEFDDGPQPGNVP
ncbi:MAG: hypothetical protein KQH59_16690 [Desulfobulbaceae bacterium]|nr:hypothetical protein [Desulfobulbaceae bacterium]